MTDEITKSLKTLEGIMKEGLEKKRPAEGPPPVEPKRVKFQHPGTKEEHEGTEMERDQKMAQWWAEIAAASASSGNVAGNPGQQMPPPGLAPPSGTPMTPVSGDSGTPIPSYGFPPPLPPGYYYGPPPPVGTMHSPNLPAPTGMDSSDHDRRDGSVSVKNVGDLFRFVIDTKIRERKSLGSYRQDFKFAS